MDTKNESISGNESNAMEVNAADIGKDIAESKPQSDENQPSKIEFPVDDAIKTGGESNVPDNLIRDSSGNVFNPEIHATDDAGNPKYTITGKFRAKRKIAGAADGAISNAPKDEERLKIEANAEVFTQAGYGVLQMVFGEEWKPDNDQEHVQMRSAVAAYMQATGKTDLPPSAGLWIAILAFSAKRVSRPKTRERLAMYFVKAKTWWKKIKEDK